MEFMNRYSIKVKLVGMTMAIIASLSAGGMFIASKMADSAQDKFGASYELLAYEFNNAIQAQFFERYGDVQAFASNPDLKNLDPVRIPKSLDFYVGLYVIYDLTMVVDAKGNFVGANLKTASGESVAIDKLKEQNFSKSEWFQAVMNGQFTEDKSKGLTGTFVEPFIRDPLLNLAFGRASYATGFSSAITDEKGQVVGVITNRTQTKWFDSIATDIYRNLEKSGMKSADIFLIDSKGYVLLDHDPSANNYKNEIIFKDDIVLKRNYASLNYAPVKLMLKNQRGYGVFENPISKDSEVVGYSQVSGSKFVDSIGWVSCPGSFVTKCGII